MNHTVTVPQENVAFIITALSARLSAIGAGYRARGQSYQDDLEIAALAAVARQLGWSLVPDRSTDGSDSFNVMCEPLR
ncbi:hypothetical protein LZ023_40700 (plasmid) [Pseudomonas silvicola]|nr:hypothetical protein LZ023_40975 [Pseudomonas silvicola]WAH62255.1 hypothetical protein LZ023_40700 [Pseudomonas silvicola]